MARLQARLTKTLRMTFPDTFLWGVSISAHQVEGNTYNQWTRWELDHAAENASNAEQRWSDIPVWDDVRAEARDPDNYITGQALRHRKNFATDFKYAKALGLNTWRFSIEWSRIEPREGTFNVEALQYYKRYIKQLRAAGLTPIVTLHHFTNPVWFEDYGGFGHKSNLRYWQRFVNKLADELEWGAIDYVCTINEPNTYSSMSYLLGEFPHDKKSKLKFLRNYKNMVTAHKIAYKILKLRHPHLRVGYAHQFAKIAPKDPKKLGDRINAKITAYIWQWWFLSRVNRHIDFVGVNYYLAEYRSKLTQMYPSTNPVRPVSDIGWYMEPEGIEQVLREIGDRTKLPIIITENGLADCEDKDRLWWIAETMQAISAARRSGVDIRGYCHWTFVDNFEWQFGWFPKFGLLSADREKGTYKVRKSAKTWSNWLHHR